MEKYIIIRNFIPEEIKKYNEAYRSYVRLAKMTDKKPMLKSEWRKKILMRCIDSEIEYNTKKYNEFLNSIKELKTM